MYPSHSVPYLPTSATLNHYSVTDPYMDGLAYHYSPYYQYEYFNYVKDRYDDSVRNKSISELAEIRQLREKIDGLAKQAHEKNLFIEQEQRKLQKEKELVLLRFNDAKRKEEIAQLERERLKDTRENMNMRYASLPRRSDLYPWPHFREFYGGPLHQLPPVVHNSCTTLHSPHGHGEHGRSCSDCGGDKVTYVLPNPAGPRSGEIRVSASGARYKV